MSSLEGDTDIESPDWFLAYPENLKRLDLIAVVIYINSIIQAASVHENDWSTSLFHHVYRRMQLLCTITQGEHRVTGWKLNQLSYVTKWVKRPYENLGVHSEVRILCYIIVSNIKFGLY